MKSLCCGGQRKPRRCSIVDLSWGTCCGGVLRMFMLSWRQLPGRAKARISSILQYWMKEEEQGETLSMINEVALPHPPLRTGKLKMFKICGLKLSLGPNHQEFLMGFLTLVLVAAALVYCAHRNVESQRHRRVGDAFAIITPVLYLLCALGNPGVFDPEKSNSKIRYCHACMHFIPKSVRHCSRCEVCIEGYDHHCPFMSKCVGRGNIVQFYLLMGFLSGYSLYMYYTIYVVVNWGRLIV